jgi:Zinc knuckle
MIELIRARRGLPNPRGVNNSQSQGQFRPRTWGGRPQNQQRPQQQRPTYNSTNAPCPAYNNIPVPMDLSRTRMPYNRRTYQINNAYTNSMQTEYNRAADTPVQQDYRPRRPKGPCFNCRKAGHFAKDCRNGPSASINYMDAVDEDMQHVPQPNITPRHDVNQLVAQIDALSKEDHDSLIEAMGSLQDFLPA